MLALQKEFVRAGGVIVRIFLGPTEKPTAEYEEVMAEMKKAGIDVRYVAKQPSWDFPFDFLYLHDEGLIAKWFAGAGGSILGHCEISNHIDSTIQQRWVSLSDMTVSPMDTIPPQRQIWAKRNP